MQNNFERLKQLYRRREANASLAGTQETTVIHDKGIGWEDMKGRMLRNFMNTPISMVTAGVGGVMVENAIGKTPSLIFGAFATYMGYLTGAKTLSALGLGMVTAAYSTHRQQKKAQEDQETVQSIFEEQAEYGRQYRNFLQLKQPEMSGAKENSISELGRKLIVDSGQQKASVATPFSLSLKQAGSKIYNRAEAEEELEDEVTDRLY